MNRSIFTSPQVPTCIEKLKQKSARFFKNLLLGTGVDNVIMSANKLDFTKQIFSKPRRERNN